MAARRIFAPILAALAFLSCSSMPPTETPNPGEKLLWSNTDQRPEWTYREASSEGDKISFVGVSDKYSTERYARDDAEQAARKKAVQYTGTQVRSMIKNVLEQVGNADLIINPERLQQEFEKQLTEGGISQLKPRFWHLEKWQDAQGAVYWKVFLFAEVPKSALDEALAKVLQAQNAKLQQQKKKETSPDKKARLEKMMNAFEDMEKKGFSLEEE